jgi:hypothetical protein
LVERDTLGFGTLRGRTASQWAEPRLLIARLFLPLVIASLLLPAVAGWLLLGGWYGAPFAGRL